MDKKIGLRFIRTQCNYTMKDLANKLSVSKGIISRWETGDAMIPNDRMLD